jgi:hypothetical protein
MQERSARRSFTLARADQGVRRDRLDNGRSCGPWPPTCSATLRPCDSHPHPTQPQRVTHPVSGPVEAHGRWGTDGVATPGGMGRKKRRGLRPVRYLPATISGYSSRDRQSPGTGDRSSKAAVRRAGYLGVDASCHVMSVVGGLGEDDHEAGDFPVAHTEIVCQ